MKSSILFLLTIIFLPTVTLAGGSAGFKPLVGIPGLTGESLTISDYVNALYGLAISVAALIAVIKIVLAGAKYMMDDIVTHKSEAKADIKNALIGLLIIIGAVIILNTINSNLTKVDIYAPIAGIDNSTDQGSELALEKALLDGYCDDGNGCQTFVCTSDFMKSMRGGNTCEEKCKNVNGVYQERNRQGGGHVPGGTYGVCALANNQISRVITDINSELIEEKCPTGNECYAESCDNYGEEYDLYSCEGACTDGTFGDGLGGVYYDAGTNSCIFVGKTNQDEAIPCQHKGCQQERNQCYDEGGYVSKATEAPLEIRCRKPLRYEPTDTSCDEMIEVEQCDPGGSGACWMTLQCA